MEPAALLLLLVAVVAVAAGWLWQTRLPVAVALLLVVAAVAVVAVWLWQTRLPVAVAALLAGLLLGLQVVEEGVVALRELPPLLLAMAAPPALAGSPEKLVQRLVQPVAPPVLALSP